MIRATIAEADLVLIPARPSPHDLRAVGIIVAMAEAAHIQFCFLVNGATPRTTIAIEAVGASAQHGKVALATLYQRFDFGDSMMDGRAVGELNPQSRSAAEVTSMLSLSALRPHPPRLHESR
jgi:chromosome partitioning protein